MKIDYIVPNMGDNTITVIGCLEQDDWDYGLESNEFEALRSENIGELSHSYGGVRYYPKQGSSIKSITVQINLINSNQFIIHYEFAFVDDFLQIPSKHMQYAIKATIKKMFNTGLRRVIDDI